MSQMEVIGGYIPIGFLPLDFAADCDFHSVSSESVNDILDNVEYLQDDAEQDTTNQHFKVCFIERLQDVSVLHC